MINTTQSGFTWAIGTPQRSVSCPVIHSPSTAVFMSSLRARCGGCGVAMRDGVGSSPVADLEGKSEEGETQREMSKRVRDRYNQTETNRQR